MIRLFTYLTFQGPGRGGGGGGGSTDECDEACVMVEMLRLGVRAARSQLREKLLRERSLTAGWFRHLHPLRTPCLFSKMKDSHFLTSGVRTRRPPSPSSAFLTPHLRQTQSAGLGLHVSHELRQVLAAVGRFSVKTTALVTFCVVFMCHLLPRRSRVESEVPPCG